MGGGRRERQIYRVNERDRGTQKERGERLTERETEREFVRERDGVYMCVCVCVRACL